MAEPQMGLLNLIVDTVREDLGYEISLTELPAEGGLYAECGTGRYDSLYYNKTAVRIIPVQFSCRDSDPKQCTEKLLGIINMLERKKTYPQGTGFFWMDASAAPDSDKRNLEQDGKYRCSCIVNCKLFY